MGLALSKRQRVEWDEILDLQIIAPALVETSPRNQLVSVLGARSSPREAQAIGQGVLARNMLGEVAA